MQVILMKCANCEKTIELLPFTCTCCGKRYCLDCRMPDGHNCEPHSRNWSAYLDNHLSMIEQEKATFSDVEQDELLRPEELDDLR
jgi:hypothetical protein